MLVVIIVEAASYRLLMTWNSSSAPSLSKGNTQQHRVATHQGIAAMGKVPNLAPAPRAMAGELFSTSEGQKTECLANETVLGETMGGSFTSVHHDVGKPENRKAS